MTQPQQQKPQDQPAQPATQQQPQKRTATPDTFADGSTKKQQDQLVKEAKEANDATRRFADAERKARQD